MSVVLVLMGLATDEFLGEPRYLRAFDPDAHDGRGEIVMTDDKTKAMRFATSSDAWRCWKTQSRTHPLRPDGEPNRPLTAYHAMIEPEE